MSQEFIATGRRKTAVARIRMTPGSGKIEVNGKAFEDDFKTTALQNTVLQPFGERPAELVVLDHDEVLEPDRVRAPRHEVAVVGKAVAAVDRAIARVERVLGEVELELVELLEVPAERAAGAVDLERVLALGPDDRADSDPP